MNPESDLAQVMAALAAEHRAVSGPHSIERAVLAEFDAARRQRIWKIATAGAIAALLVAGVFGILEPPRRRPSASTNAVQTIESRAIEPGAMNDAAAKDAAAKEIISLKATRRSPPSLLPAPPTDSPAPGPQDPFVTIPYTVPLAPEESATIVRMTLSPAALAAVGLPFPAVEIGSALQADVLVSEDGRARAFRIVSDSSFR